MAHVEQLIILTGGPGAGKSTVINALAERGLAHSVEAGRGVILDQMRIDGQALPWRQPALFAELMLAWEMRSYHLAEAANGLVFFDRGVPDIVGYLQLMGLPIPPHIDQAARIFRYRVQAFVAPPWPEIFCQDSERKQTFDEAVHTFEAVRDTYQRYGYQLIELPCLPVAERVQFILSRCGLPGLS